MSNITVRKEGNTPVPARPAEWDPFRMARELLRWDPFREMATIAPTFETRAVFTPSFEVKETKDAYVFKADLPGVKDADLEVTRTGNRLTISGKRDEDREEKTETYYAYERSYGSFTRAFTLPDGIDADQIHADLKDGVLTLVVPKKPEAQPQKIALKTGGEKQS